jgi:hypothetical protein
MSLKRIPSLSIYNFSILSDSEKKTLHKLEAPAPAKLSDY